MGRSYPTGPVLLLTHATSGSEGPSSIGEVIAARQPQHCNYMQPEALHRCEGKLAWAGFPVRAVILIEHTQI